MPPWILKAAVQGVVALLPDAETWNQRLQRYITGSLELEEKTLATKFQRCRRHLAAYSGNGKHDLGVLELGTGWFPIAPIGFALCGAGRVWTVDNVSHLAVDRVAATLKMFLGVAPRLEGVAPDRIARCERALAERDVDAMLAAVGVERVVGDARTMELGGKKVDLFVSNNTLEHIPYEVMVDIFKQFRRLAADGAVMSHWIDMSDHYMNFDSSIGPYNFLKFSPRVWRLFNNDLQYQNRLRISDFRRLHAETGWRLVKEDNTAGTPDDLRRIRVAREFRERYREEDLLVYETWMTSRPD